MHTMAKRIRFLILAAALAAGTLGCQRDVGDFSGSMPDFVSISPSASGTGPLKVISSEETAPSQSSDPTGAVDAEPASSAGPHSPEQLSQLIPWQKYLFGGGEDYRITRVEELENSNPWTEEADLKTLPVYQNIYVSSEDIPKSVRMTEGLTAKRASQEEMEAAAYAVAQELGAAADSMEVFPSEELIQRFKTQKGEVPKEYQYVNSVTLSCDGGKITIEVDTELGLYINFEPDVELPQEYTLKMDASYEEQVRRGEYLLEIYGKSLHMEKPVLDISRKDNTGGILSFCHVYEGAGDLEQQILNYRFNTAWFTLYENGHLASVRIKHFELSDKLGDYPIITVEEARKKLKEGKYMKGSVADFPGEEHIARVELIYNIDEVVWMPYYCFYAEIGLDDMSFPPETDEDRLSPSGKPLKGYTTFYVPAVEEEYIKLMPSKEGYFDQ